jgi:hypothetical protein
LAFKGDWEPLIPEIIAAAEANDPLQITITDAEYKKLSKGPDPNIPVGGNAGLRRFCKQYGLSDDVFSRLGVQARVRGRGGRAPMLCVYHFGSC